MKHRITYKQLAHYGIIILMLACFIGVIFVFQQKQDYGLINKTGVSYEKAKVLSIEEEQLQDVDEVGYSVGTQRVQVEIISGDLTGDTFTADNYISYLGGVECHEGQTVIVNISESTINDTTIVGIYTENRAPIMYIFIGIFVLVMCLIGGKQGLKSSISLGFTFLCVIFIFIPMLFMGYSPVLAAIFICLITTVFTMYMIGGFSTKTAASIAGTVGGVVIAALCAKVACSFAGVSGFNMNEAEDLVVIARSAPLQVEGILFAGILIAALGAVMDVAMSVASTIHEIHDKNPSLTRKELFMSGIHVGRDMMGTMSNTLILAFAGGSLPTMIFIYAYATDYHQFMNTYSIGIEIIQGIAGSMGVILTVPLTALLSAFLIHRKKNSGEAVIDEGLSKPKISS